MKCYLCGKGELVKKEVVRKLYGKTIRKFRAEVCTKCNEVFYDEETSKNLQILSLYNLIMGDLGNFI